VWSESFPEGACRDASDLLNTQVLDILDGNFHQLLWTVMVGVLSTGALVRTALFADPVKGAPLWRRPYVGL
jgi:hypothetical protein